MGRARFVRDEGGAIAVSTVLLLIVFIAALGSVADMGLLLIEKANLRNVADSAALAGARALVSGTNPGPTAAAAAATQYLAVHGIQQDASTTVTYSYLNSPTTGLLDRMKVDLVRQQPASFLTLVGLTGFSIAASSEAEAEPRMVDIGLSLDLTGSMELSGTNDLDQLRRAVVEFINDVDPSPSVPDGPQIAMARFAGIMCGWNRSSKTEQFINLGPGSSEYVAPCGDDKTVLTNLTLNQNLLLQLANNSGSGSCPFPQYACPLVSWTYAAQDIHGSGVAQGMSWSGQEQTSLNPTYTGTKLPNAISVFSDGGYYAWSSANGGRNNVNGEGTAHKVLVMITDGNDELWPDVGMPSGISTSSWDSEFLSRANALKLGPDGQAGTDDDVEIYTIGFYCTPYSSGTASSWPPNWCTSRMADTASPHPCPSAHWDPSQASATDTLLYEASSSSPGTCDHYFPIKKTESLPPVFKQIASEIARSHLVG
ncbi:MAG: pilus assembly protein [Chloroflexi bacterium]|nr:pilus assembly protein [Chloroflexota bacterium]